MTMTDTATATEQSNRALVSSSEVNGTEVYGRDGAHVGTIDHLMIDKVSGKVGYAVMRFGGFLGMGEEHIPVPWGKLSYDTDKNGFLTDLTEDQVRGAPERQENRPFDPDWEARTHAYYGIGNYWL